MTALLVAAGAAVGAPLRFLLARRLDFRLQALNNLVCAMAGAPDARIRAAKVAGRTRVRDMTRVRQTTGRQNRPFASIIG